MLKRCVCLLCAGILLCAAASALGWELSPSRENFIANPVKGAALTSLTVAYTIVWSDGADMTGQHALLAFSNADFGGRVSFQSLPSIDFRGDGLSLSVAPSLSPVAGCERGRAYTFQWTITPTGASLWMDGVAVGGLRLDGSASFQDVLDQAAASAYFFVGVGGGRHSAAWDTESCTLTDVTINGRAVQF